MKASSSIFSCLFFLTAVTFLFSQAPENKNPRENESGPEEKPKSEMKVKKISEVVVTGTKTPKNMLESPIKTTVVDGERMWQKNARDLAGALENEIGVNVRTTCQNCSAPEVRLIGLEGSYSQILINGMPIVSPLAGVYFLEQMPTALIDRVEIVKGGASALYGGNAVGGVINVITRSPLKYGHWTPGNHFGFGTEAGMMQNPDNNIVPVYKYDGHAEIVLKEAPVAFSLAGSFLNKGDDVDFYDRDLDGFSEMPIWSNTSLYSSLLWRPNDNNLFNLTVTRVNDKLRGGDRFSYPEHQTGIAESAKTERTSILGSWELGFMEKNMFKLYSSYVFTDRKSFYGGGQQEGAFTYEGEDGTMITDTVKLGTDAYGYTKNPEVVVGSDVKFNLFNGNDLLTGVQYQYRYIEDFMPRLDINSRENINAIGVFLQDDWDITEWLGVLAGVRMDKHSEINTLIFLPRGGVKIGPDMLKMRLNYSTGYRSPAKFDEEFHIGAVGEEAKGYKVIMADGLRPEFSHSFTGSLDFTKMLGTVSLGFGVGGFWTVIQDAFNNEPSGSTDEYVLYKKVNRSGADVAGAEAKFDIGLARWLDFEIGFMYQLIYDYKESIEYSNENSTKIPGTPLFSGNALLRISPPFLDALDVIFGANLLGPMQMVHVKAIDGEEAEILNTTTSFTTVDAKLAYKIRRSKQSGKFMQVYIGGKNITDQFQPDLDKGSERDSGYIYGPRTPRFIYAGLRSEF